MNKNNSTHIHGKSGQEFAEMVRGIPQEQILCVSLDISKYFHVVMIHNSLGEVVTPTFEIDIYQSGFEQLCQAIDEARSRTQAQVVLVGMEPTGHYFDNLARHLLSRPQPVKLINSYAVKKNREQQMMWREKTDPIDAAAIGDLLRRGEGTPYRPAEGVYLQLQQIDRMRLSKVKIERMLKNQIIGHLDRIFPGLLLEQAARKRYTPLFVTDFWRCRTLQGLIRICPDPRQLMAMSPQQLVQAFHAHHRQLGLAAASKIIAQAHQTLLPDADLVAIRCDLLGHDQALLETVQFHIAALEQRLAELVVQTPYRIWTKLKGLSITQVASLAAAIGNPASYADAAQVFRRSGLVSGRHDSGTCQLQGKNNPITKVGDVYLRRALMDAVPHLILHQPVLRCYNYKLQASKPAGVARVATARKTLGILWAILRDQFSNSLLYHKGADM